MTAPLYPLPDSQETRDVWVKQMTRHLFGAFALGLTTHYTEAECAQLADVLYDLPQETKIGAMKPEEMILEALLRMQDFEPTTAHILAISIPRIDFSRLLLQQTEAATVLGINPTTLGQYRRIGKFRADLTAGRGTIISIIAYRLDRLLAVLARDRHKADPRAGGPHNARFE